MKVKDLITELQKQNPEDEATLSDMEATIYVESAPKILDTATYISGIIFIILLIMAGAIGVVCLLTHPEILK